MDFLEGTSSTLGRAVSAHIRAHLGAQRMSGKTLASRIGKSQNYVATRLRDELPFTLDDIEDIVRVLEPDPNPAAFVKQAEATYSEAVWDEADDLAVISLRGLLTKPHDTLSEKELAFIDAHRKTWQQVQEERGEIVRLADARQRAYLAHEAELRADEKQRNEDVEDAAALDDVEDPPTE